MSLPTTCPNCESPIPAGANFCLECGQRADTHRLNMHEIRHNAVHAFFHADKSVLHLMKDLAIAPGRVAKEYVEGKRKRYFNPFTFFVLTVALSAFATSYFHLMTAREIQNPVTGFIEKNVNLVFFAAVPIAALYSTWLFKKWKFNYAENLVLHTLISGFRVVFYLLVFTPLVLLFRKNYDLVLIIYMVAWVIYSIWAHRQFFGGTLAGIAWRTIVINLLTQATIFLLISAGAVVYYTFIYKKQPTSPAPTQKSAALQLSHRSQQCTWVY